MPEVRLRGFVKAPAIACINNMRTMLHYNYNARTYDMQVFSERCEPVNAEEMKRRILRVLFMHFFVRYIRFRVGADTVMA